MGWVGFGWFGLGNKSTAGNPRFESKTKQEDIFPAAIPADI